MNAPKLSTLRVVILDPDPAKHQAELVRSVLTMLEVTMIRDANDAGRLFSRLRQFQADILIAAVSPAEAVVLANAVRRDAASPNRELPIIAVVAPMTPAELVHVRDAGVTEILVLPITAKAMAARIESAIRRRRGFVESPVFIGPDRRRREGGYGGLDRRNR